MTRPSRQTIAGLRHRLYALLEHGPIGDRGGRIAGQLLVALIVVNLIAVILESVPAYEAEFGKLFLAIELFSLVVFTFEYGLRVWVAVEHAPYRHLKASVARLRFVTSPFGIVDLPAVLARLRGAGRPAGGAHLPRRPLPQACALFAQHALAARGALQRAPSAVR